MMYDFDLCVLLATLYDEQPTCLLFLDGMNLLSML